MSHNPRVINYQASINADLTTAQQVLDDQLVVYGDNSYRYDDDGYLVEKVTPEL